MTQRLNKVTCGELAHECSTREQYKERHPSAYRLSKRAGWLAKWFPIHRTLDKNECERIAKACSSRSELGIKDPPVYHKCSREGWLDKFFPKTIRNLTHDFCKEIAMKFSSRSQLKNADGPVYEASRKNGWLAEFYPTLNYAGRGELTKEFCHSIAKTCNSRGEFHKKDASAYGKSVSKGWINEFFPITMVHAPYTHDECRELALRCDSKSAFKKLNASAYSAARINGWLSEFTHFKDTSTVRSEVRRKYSDEFIISEAKKYTTLADFRKHSPAACQIAYRRGLMNTFTWLEHPRLNDSDNIYVYEFKDLGYAYIGRTIHPKYRNETHHNIGSPVYKFATENHVNIPEPKYVRVGLNPFTEGRLAEQEIISKYKADGWKLLNNTVGGELGGLGRMKYSKKTCLDTAKKYTTKIDFMNNDIQIYRFAKKHGYLGSYTWLKSMKTSLSHWNYETCAEEAKKYETRSEYYACSKGAYDVAKQNGWLDEFFPKKK